MSSDGTVRDIVWAKPNTYLTAHQKLMREKHMEINRDFIKAWIVVEMDSKAETSPFEG